MDAHAMEARMKSRLVWTLVQGLVTAVSLVLPVCPALLGQDFEWVRQFRAEVCNSISVDPEAVYLAGSTDGVLPDQTSAGELDAFVRRYDRSGMEVWTRQFGTNASDAACAVSFDASGIYVGGWTAGVFPGQAAGGLAFLRKYDRSGTEVWTRQFGENSILGTISADSSGIYAAGITDSTLPGQMSSGGSDAFVRKYDPDGSEVWTRQFGSDDFDSVQKISIDSSGLYVGGITRGELPGQIRTGSSDAFLRKYDRIGKEIWTRQFGPAQITGVFADSSGVYVAGDTIGVLKGTGFDVFLRKYDAGGAEIWSRQFGSEVSEQALGGVFATATGVYVAGTTGGVLPGANRGYFPGQETAGDFDYFLKNYDLNGAEVWTCQSRTGGHGEVVGIAGDPSGVFIVGITDGNAQRADVFVAKLKDVAHGCAPLFRRGDTNADTSVNLTDAMTILGFMFLGGGSPGCAKAADVNDDGANNLSDALTLLGYLFLGGQAPPEPFSVCGSDPTPEDGLGCESQPPC
jgi:hypothetical protein